MCCTRAWVVPSWSPAWGASADIMPVVISAWELDLGVWRPGTAQQQPLSGVHAWTQLHLPSRWHRLNVCTPPHVSWHCLHGYLTNWMTPCMRPWGPLHEREMFSEPWQRTGLKGQKQLAVAGSRLVGEPARIRVQAYVTSTVTLLCWLLCLLGENSADSALVTDTSHLGQGHRILLSDHSEHVHF
jgi:hypothetical protein